MRFAVSVHNLFKRTSLDLLAYAVLWATCAAASAAPISKLSNQGLDHTFGSYAPLGDCAKEPRVTIDKSGMIFRANGRDFAPPFVEYAPGFFGQADPGLTAVFYPFPVSSSDFGPLVMFVNDQNRRGVIRFEADRLPGQHVDPFHAAFMNAGLFTLCAAQPAAAMSAPPPTALQAISGGTPLKWTNLADHVGKFPGTSSKENIDLFNKGDVAAALKTLLGSKMPVLQENLSVVSPLQRAGRYFYLTGNASNQGGIEQAYIMIDPARRVVQVGLWERGKLTVYPPEGGPRLPVSPGIKMLLDNSPSETAVPLPGTPWEVVPVDGRAPIAYVSAAASPNIEALTLYCEGGKPFMAMLLTRPATPSSMTMTWNFSGRLVNIPVQRANAAGTYWIGGISGTDLLPLIMQQRNTAMLRINGRDEGAVSLDGSSTVLRHTLRPCARL